MADGEEQNQLAKFEASEMEQIELALKGEEKPFIDRSERVFERTGERFIRDYPERAARAIKLIALGFKNKPIARDVHADVRTIRELRLRCITEIGKQKEELRSVVFPGAMLCAERTIEDLPNMKGAAASIAFGIFADKFMQLSGVPQAHIEVNHKFDLGAELQKLNDTAMEKMRQAKARVVEPAALEKVQQ